MRRLTIAMWVVLALVAGALLTGCGGGSSSSSGDSSTSGSEKVSIDVGNGTPIEVTKGKPKVALLWTSGNLFLDSFERAAKAEASARGIDLTVLDSKFDPDRQ